MHKIRVLHVIGSSKFGGASTIILELCRLVRRNGWDVDVLADDPIFQQAVLDEGLGSVPMPGIDRAIRPWKDFAALFRLYRFLRESKYTLVHTHTSKGGFLGRIAARLAGVPVIIHTAHGFAIHEKSPFWQKLSYAALERFAASCCDAVVCVSEFHRAWGERLHLAPRKKLFAIPNGIRPDTLQPSLSAALVRRSIRVRAGTTVLLCPGRLARQKGIEYLLAAVAQLRQTLGDSFHLYIAGDGPARKEYEQLAHRLDLHQHVSFLGFRNDIPNLLAAADIVVLPSIREGLSLALLEAMAASKPIIATSIGSNREVQGALLVDPANTEQLAAAIARLCQDPHLAKCLGAYAGALLRNRYTEKRMIEDYWQIYRELMANKGIFPDSQLEDQQQLGQHTPAGIASSS